MNCWWKRCDRNLDSLTALEQQWWISEHINNDWYQLRNLTHIHSWSNICCMLNLACGSSTSSDLIRSLALSEIPSHAYPTNFSVEGQHEVAFQAACTSSSKSYVQDWIAFIISLSVLVPFGSNGWYPHNLRHTGVNELLILVSKQGEEKLTKYTE